MHYHDPTPSTGFHRQETTIDKKFVGRYLTYPPADCVRQAEGGKRLKGVLAKSRVDEPLVTIITVCWNSARTIEQSILSVLNQTYENIEYLVIDGNSTDGTLGILRKYEAEIDYYVSELDDGLYYAMNKGLELAQGDYILLLNSDDWYAENAVERLVAAKSYSGCSFVSAQARHVDAKGQLADVMRVMHFDYAVYLRTPLRHETMLLPCQVYDQIGPYNTDFRIISDYDYLIRLFEAGYTHYQLHEPLLMFRQTGISHTDTGKMVAEREALLAARFPFLDKRGIDLLIDRDHHSGGDLLELASQHSGNATFVNAIYDYVRDHASIALQGRGKKAWRPYANDLLAEIKNYSETGSPLVSVILAVYNGEQTIRACIDSVLGQMFRDIELICVNDQTPDNSQAIIDEYCAKDPRVRSVTNERNIGLGATRNRGIREARGSYLFHIDPDDTIPENALQVLVNYATKHDSELVRGAYLRKQFHHGSNFKPQIIHPLGSPKTLINKTLRDIPELLSTPEGHWAYLYRVDLARRVPYPEDLKMGQDAIFLFSIVPVASKITVIPDVVYNYLENPASAMNVFILQKYIDVLEWRRRAICMLEDCGLNDLATNLRNGIPRLHWHDRFLKFNDESPDPSAINRLSRILRAIYKNSGALKMDERIPERRRKFLQMLFMTSILPHSTLKNVTSVVPATNDNRIVGKYLTYPDITGKRKAQGGLRMDRKFKCSLPDLPLISIITVCLNSEKTLEQCIQSVLQQTYSNIEYIIIDGNSTDGTVELIEKYEDVVDYFLSEPDRGLYHAMNKGLELATGDYILILNSDDWYEKDCVESLVKAKKYAGTSFVSALAQYVDQAGKPVQVMRSMPYDAGLRLRMPLRHETMLLSAEIYNTIGLYDESCRIIADFHLTTRLFENGYTHYEIPRPLMFFCNTGVSTTSLDKLFVERERLIRRQFPFLEPGEEKLFGNLGKLTPHDLENIAKRYNNNIQFIRTLKCYFENRKRYSNLALWKNYEINWQVITKNHDLPLISVILPVFNAQETLAACIESVLSQTLRDFELICINDSSPDDSQTIIEQYRLQDLRIISLVNDTNVGLGASRNRGVREAKGTYIFHIDPDDTIPPQALEALYTHAAKHGSDIVKGAYLHEQFLLGQKPKHTERKGLAPNADAIINTSLAQMNDLLKTTEGHWSCLYNSQLAKRVPYPTDLKMGQDSIYLVNVMAQAQKISLISDVVYHYRANSESAMNTFSFQKFNDALEWRRRAWHVLKDRGMQEVGDRLLQVYWGDAFFRNLAKSVTRDQMSKFLGCFRAAFSEAGVTTLTLKPSKFLSELFPLILEGREDEAFAFMLGNPDNRDAVDVKREKMPLRPVRARNHLGKPIIKVATLCSMDHGGAGTGTQRRVEALRRNGVDARIYSLVVKSTHSYVERVVPQLPSVDTTQDMLVWRAVRERAILPVKQVPGFCATELFSLTDSVVDIRRMTKCFDDFDVIHLHWVVGMFDFKHAGEYLAKKPLIWTLADMNAFTGGCHYSEGCEEYTQQCKVCPLLGGKSDLAHKTWKIKNAAYQQLKKMHIICPSQWMAERAAKSSLLGGKQIHYIPNAYPTERLKLTNKVLARIHLGLPVNKKLLLFGADSLGSYRKGGDLLRKSIDVFLQKKRQMQVEIIVFGNNSIKLPLPVHNLGYISDDEKLALAYSAADAFLFPSREDNAPLTVGESLLCGTPVVTFPVGHVPDIVKHRVTGYVAKYLDVDDFATGIEWALNCAKNAEIKREITCRLSACGFHDPLKSVKRHLAVYHMAMRNNT